jgi:hypothetical protein
MKLVSLGFVLALFAVGCDHGARPSPFARFDDPGAVKPAADHQAEWRSYLTAQRKLELQRLDEYGKAGQFAMADSRVDGRGLRFVWRDGSGRLCAMAHLVAKSGREDLVEKVASTDNSLQLANVKDGELYEWMLRSGLTQEEIQLVQFPGFSLQQRDLQTMAIEIQRKKEHFANVVVILRETSDKSVEVALARLGDRARNVPPPAPAV